MQGAVGAALGLQLAPAITFVVLVTRDLRKRNPWECCPDARVVLITLGASSGSEDLDFVSSLLSVWQSSGAHGTGLSSWGLL